MRYPAQGHPDKPHPVSVRTIRRVWAAISAHPTHERQALIRELGMARRTFYAALWRLREAGYIRNEGRGAYVIVVPFIITRKETA